MTENPYSFMKRVANFFLLPEDIEKLTHIEKKDPTGGKESGLELY